MAVSESFSIIPELTNYQYATLSYMVAFNQPIIAAQKKAFMLPPGANSALSQNIAELDELVYLGFLEELPCQDNRLYKLYLLKIESVQFILGVATEAAQQAA